MTVAIAAAMSSACAAIGVNSGTAGTDAVAAERPANKAKKQREPKAALAEPQGLNVSVNAGGMTISWLDVDGATDGYAVAVDGAWRQVQETKVHYDQLLPGLPYRVEVAGMAGGRRGIVASTTVGPERGPTPPVIMSATPPPPPPAVESAGPDSESSVGAAPPGAGSDSIPDVVAVTTNGCGFTADGVADLEVTVLLAGSTALRPAVLTDDSGRLYLPIRAGAQPPTAPQGALANTSAAYSPVAVGLPPDRASIDRLVFMSSSAGEAEYHNQSIDSVEWGHELCSPPVEQPRW